LKLITEEGRKKTTFQTTELITVDNYQFIKQIAPAVLCLQRKKLLNPRMVGGIKRFTRGGTLFHKSTLNKNSLLSMSRILQFASDSAVLE
jgi:hypothetical protein